MYNSLRAGPGGTLYGLGAKGIFTFDDESNRVVLVAPFQSISGGMAIRGQEIFFTAGPDVVSYKLPVPAASPPVPPAMAPAAATHRAPVVSGTIPPDSKGIYLWDLVEMFRLLR